MNRTESALTFAAVLGGLDDREQREGLPALSEGDRTARDRAQQVYVRLIKAVSDDGLPDLRLIEEAGAHLVALHRWAFGVHTLAVVSGDELEDRRVA